MKWKTKGSASTQAGTCDEDTFFQLCRAGDINRLLLFLQGQRNVQEMLDATDMQQARTGLHFAVDEGNSQVAEYLLNKGAKVDARDRTLRTPLHIACLKGYPTIAKLLLDFNADPLERNSSGLTMLHMAVCAGSTLSSLELIVLLCRADSDLVHLKDHTGRTPLHFSVFNQQPDMTKILQKLVQYGADVNARDHEGNTALHFAAESGKGKVCQLLI
jgi:ankyrin repeat protein